MAMGGSPLLLLVLALLPCNALAFTCGAQSYVKGDAGIKTGAIGRRGSAGCSAGTAGGWWRRSSSRRRGCESTRWLLSRYSADGVLRSQEPRFQRLKSAAIVAESMFGDAPPKLPNYGLHTRIKGSIVSLTGLMYALSTFGWAAVLFPFVCVAWVVARVVDNEKRRPVDFFVRLWARLSMATMTYKPQVLGKENLPPVEETVMYIPNHSSFMDILTLSGFLPRVVKYVSKEEIKKIPMIGAAMQMARHLFITRGGDARSQLNSFKECVEALKQGNSLVTFAEGTRSKTGRLLPLKKGPFTMAKRAGVRIVPVSLVNVHTVMPCDACMPVTLGRHPRAKLVIHPPIETKDRPEAEVMEECRAALIAGLPHWQRPLRTSGGGA